MKVKFWFHDVTINGLGNEAIFDVEKELHLNPSSENFGNELIRAKNRWVVENVPSGYVFIEWDDSVVDMLSSSASSI